MRTNTLLGAVAATTLLLSGSGLRADEPKPDAPKPAAAAPAQAPAAGKKLTDAELLKMVEDLGYDIIARPKETDAIKRVNIMVKRGTFECPMSVNLSGGDQTQLMAFVNVGKLGEAELANAPRLAKLLELNDGFMGQCQFRVNPKTKVLWLARISENRGVTAKVLRDHIEETLAAAYDTQADWDYRNWGMADATKTEAKAEPKEDDKKAAK